MHSGAFNPLSLSNLVFVTGPPVPYKTRPLGKFPASAHSLAWNEVCFSSFPAPTPSRGPTPAMPRTGHCKFLVGKNRGQSRE